MFTNEELIERFKMNLERKNKSTHTVRSFTSTINKLSKSVNLINCTLFDLEDFIDLFKSNGNSASTINQRIVAINQFFRYLQDAQIRTDNPSTAITQLQMEVKQKEFKLLDSSTYMDIYKDSKIDEAIRVAIMLSVMGGLRTEEICNLKVRNIDFEECVITVEHGKGNKTRLVGVSEKLINIIKVYMEHNNITSGALIRNKQGNPMLPKNFQNRFATIRKNYGFDKEIHIHSGRHKNATELIIHGTPVALVSRNLGHSSVVITEKFYVHTKPEAIRSHINNIW